MSSSYLICECCHTFPAITRVNAAPIYLNEYREKYVCRLCADRIAQARYSTLETTRKLK